MLRRRVVVITERNDGLMRRTRITTIVLTFIVLSAKGFEALPTQDGGRSILERVELTYKSLASYQFEGTISLQISSATGVINVDSPFVMAAIKPDRIRFELWELSCPALEDSLST